MSAAEAETWLAEVCPIMREAVTRHAPWPGASRGDQNDPYAALFRAVVYQQISGKAAATILARTTALFPNLDIPAAAAFLEIDPDALRGTGLSRQKQAALRDLAQKRLAGVVPDADALVALPDAAIIARLTAVRGVGLWTAQMYLMFTLGRPDIWPHDDLGVRNGVERLYGDRLGPKALKHFGERFAPFRSAAAWHCWRAVDAAAP
jgi:DNA-3-methyladenine glycosylase II